MSVSILYYKVSPEQINSAQHTEQFKAWSAELPEIKQQQVKKLQQKSDRVLSLIGLQLLKIDIADFSHIPFQLSEIQFPEKGKPFYQSEIDFNISDSSHIACIVISNSQKIGIDIELQHPVYTATMKKFITK